MIVGGGYLYGAGTIKTEQEDVRKLANSGNVDVDLKFRWGFFDEKQNFMKHGARDFKDVNDFKEINIKICPGDIITAEFVGYDGSVSTSCPVNSLSLRLANVGIKD